MTQIPFLPIQQHVVTTLEAGLPQHLTYHCLGHTLDVLKQARIIAKAEGITKAEELFVLKVAALYHDAGFLSTYQNHEDYGCRLARQELPRFGCTQKQIEKVCALILATKIPQNPQSLLEQIICDADLDYLGREDFTPIAHNLFQELLSLNLVSSEEEWDMKQVKFLEEHQYFTSYAKQNREKKKQVHLQHLKTKTRLVL